jgi:hypothetical protein
MVGGIFGSGNGLILLAVESQEISGLEVQNTENV